MPEQGIDFWAKTTADGKPGISVRDHCLNVGTVAEAMRELLLSSIRALLPPETLVLVAGHDIGKITVGFLRKCPAWLATNGLIDQANAGGWQFSESNHAAVSQDFFFDFANALVNPVWGVWFGRKCCLPATPVQPVVGNFRLEVFRQLLTHCRLPDRELDTWEREEETDDLAESHAAFDDQPVSYGTGKSSGALGRQFRLRRVRLLLPSP